jgi:phosphoribosylaminoimidazolecarboxamide formyltransferase/IMP cyclohydrolase
MTGNLVPIRRALISVSDKTDLIPFARALAEMRVEIISTGGTAAALSAAGIQALSVDQVTGFPEMMDGRVKTLHPAIHGALLGRRDVPNHVQAMRDHRITPIDLVCVSLYPFERTILQPGIAFEQAIEQIDIGGPSMLRSAAKNFAFVTVLTSAEQYDRVISEMKANDGATTLELRRDFAAAAFTRTAEYDTAISAWMGTRRDDPFPSMLRLTYAHASDLRYGENPHQKAAVYKNPASAEPSVVSARVLHGKELSYNNLHDGAAALELVQELFEVFPAPGMAGAAVIKHANPCGAAIGATLAEAFDKAYSSDPLAAYGGILAVNRPIDRETAQHICDGQKFLEVIIAPAEGDAAAFSRDALELLRGRWARVRLLETCGIRHTGQRKINYKSIPGGMLVQERDMKLANVEQWIHAAGPPPDENTTRDAAFAWTIAKHLKSNAIAIAVEGQLIGAGMGQVDRVSACRLAIERAEKNGVRNRFPPVAASDAFFPFPDGPRLLIDAGVRCIVHPGGSKRDGETLDLCDQHGVTCLITGVRHFKH